MAAHADAVGSCSLVVCQLRPSASGPFPGNGDLALALTGCSELLGFLSSAPAAGRGRHQKGLPRAEARARQSGWHESRCCLGPASPVLPPFSLIPEALAKLIERRTRTLVVSVPAVQGHGVFLEWEDGKAGSVDFCASCGCQGWPTCPSPTVGHHVPLNSHCFQPSPSLGCKLRLRETLVPGRMMLAVLTLCPLDTFIFFNRFIFFSI